LSRLPSTHCKHGHPLVEGNVYLRPRGNGGVKRACITCAKRRSHEKAVELVEQRHTQKRDEDAVVSAPIWQSADLAYLAGIIDGEGSFALHYSKSRSRMHVQLQIGNTDLRLMDWIRTKFGGSVTPERRTSSKWKLMFRWVAQSDTLSHLTRAVLPYLIVKRQQAELLLAFRATLALKLEKSYSTHAVSTQIFEQRLAIRDQLRVLNKRGA
jgi:hypothetical protein